MCLSWFSIKNPKSYLVFPPGRSGECIYTGSSVKKTKEEEKKKKSPPKRLMCVNIYIYIFIYFLISYKQHPSVFSFSFVYFYPSSFLFCCVGYVLLIKSFLSSFSLSLSLSLCYRILFFKRRT